MGLIKFEIVHWYYKWHQAEKSDCKQVCRPFYKIVQT